MSARLSKTPNIAQISRQLDNQKNRLSISLSLLSFLISQLLCSYGQFFFAFIYFSLTENDTVIGKNFVNFSYKHKSMWLFNLYSLPVPETFKSFTPKLALKKSVLNLTRKQCVAHYSLSPCYK